MLRESATANLSWSLTKPVTIKSTRVLYLLSQHHQLALIQARLSSEASMEGLVTSGGSSPLELTLAPP